MALLLSLDTSTSVCSIAIHENKKCLGVSELFQEQAHGAKLAVLIEQLVRQCDIKMNSLAAVAVGSGPGSYTGLRIGTATAKGICFALNIPLLAVNSLTVMARQVNRFNTGGNLLCPMIDARRMEVYCTVMDAAENILEPVQAKIIDDTAFAPRLENRSILFFGNGSDKCRNVIKHPRARFIDNIYPSAEALGELAHEKFLKNEFENLDTFEPFYLKDFVIKKPKQEKA